LGWDYPGAQYYTDIIIDLMEQTENFKLLAEIVKSINPKAKIEENTALIGESILDSLEFMNYITKVEESFCINISDDDISSKNLGIISNMISFINSKVQAR